MATVRPVLCPNCGAQVRKTGYCSACYMHINVLRKAYNTSNYYYNIGYDKAAARDLSGAVESLNMSLRYNKKNIMTRNLLGLIYYEMGEVVTALSHWVMSVNYQTSGNMASKYLKELRQDPTGLDSVDQIARKYNMALGYVQSEDFDLAILQLKSVLAANPHFVKGYLLLALLYINSGNYEKARVTLRRVLKIDKANPMAIHYLHEMGDTDENIIQMRSESVENDGLLDDDFMEEAVATDSEAVSAGRHTGIGSIKEIIARQSKKVVKTGEFGEISMARYSGMYVLVGLVLGVLLLFFAVMPFQRKKLRNENEQLIKTYSEELAAKNSTIIALNDEVEQLNKQIEDMVAADNNSDNPLPDYSDVQHGMSENDIQNMIDNE